MHSVSVRDSDYVKKWLIVDAQGMTLGRLATEIARTLRGKHKPCFQPHLDCGDHVVVINAAEIRLSGNKWREKLYYHHTGYIGGLKSINASDLKEKAPEKLLTLAVRGMLPKNKLGRKMLTNLKVFPGTSHDHEAQKPEPMPPRIKP